MSIASSPWIKAKTAANRLGTTVYQIHRLAIAGKIRTKVEFGRTPDFNAEDIDRLQAEDTPVAAAS